MKPAALLNINPEWAKLPLFNGSGWKRLPFGDVAENIRESVMPTPADSATYIGLEHMDSGSLHVRRWGSEADLIGQKLRMRRGDILFARRNAYLKRVAIAPHDGLFSAHGMILRAKTNIVLSEFLPFLMMSDMFMARAEKISVGSLSPTINWTTLKLEEFDLPSLDQQRRITDILLAMDKALSRWHDTLRAIEDYSRAISDSLFEENQRKRHVIASEVCELITVGIVVKPASYYTDANAGVPALRSLNVFPSRYDLNDLVFLTPDGHKKNSKSVLKKGDVVVVRTGRPGDAAVVTEEIAGMNLIDLILVRPKPILLPEYLAEFLNSAFGRRKIYKGSAGTAQQHFNVSEFERLDIPVPPIAEQQDAIKELASFRAQFQLCQGQFDRLTALQATMVGTLLQ